MAMVMIAVFAQPSVWRWNGIAGDIVRSVGNGLPDRAVSDFLSTN